MPLPPSGKKQNQQPTVQHFNCKVITHWDLSYLVASDIATFWLANKMVYKNFSEKISTPFMHNQSKSFLSSICTDPVIVWLLVSPTLWSVKLVVFVLKFPITPRFFLQPFFLQEQPGSANSRPNQGNKYCMQRSTWPIATKRNATCFYKKQYTRIFQKNSVADSLLFTARSDSLLSSVCTVPLFVCSSVSATLDNTLFPDVEFVALLVPTLSGRSQAVTRQKRLQTNCFPMSSMLQLSFIDISCKQSKLVLDQEEVEATLVFC